MNGIRKLVFIVAVLSASGITVAATSGDPMLYGFATRFGGRYDNVRMCVGSPAGAKGGPAGDVSVFVDVPACRGASLHVDLPVMRPILFAFAFKMLQFEPSASLRFIGKKTGGNGWVAGPALGVSLNYGPDYRSENSGGGRTTSFFSLGPTIGGYAGLDFRRPGETFNFQLGISPYVTPLFGIDDPGNHKGVVVGCLVDGLFRFGNRE